MIFFRSAQTYERLFTGLLVILLIMLAGCSSAGTTATPTPTPTQSALSPSLEFVDFDLGLPAKALNAPVTGTVPDDTTLHVVITFKTNQSTLNQLKSQKVQPGQTTNLQNQANKIGISDATYAQIKAYLGVENVTLKLDTLHTNLDVDGKAGSFARIFQTHFILHQLNGRTFFAPATAPKVPKFMADQIAAITGLDNYSQAPRNHIAYMKPLHTEKSMARSTSHTSPNCSVDTNLLTPAQVAHAYGYDKLLSQGWQGQGMTVNFVELEGFDPKDVQNYFACVQFNGHLKTVNVGTAPPSTAGAGEATLDIEMVAGLAPAINMVVYQSAFDPNNPNVDFWTIFNDQLAQIVNDNAKTSNPSVVSISWGYAEDSLTEGVVKAIGTNLQLLTQAEHMTVFVASGDCGAFDEGVYKSLQVDYPGSDPSATDVGGTLLKVDNQGNRANEVVWSDGSNTGKCTNQWGSGGGLSQIFKQPDWTSVEGMHDQYSTGNRQVPDLSAVAFNLPAYIKGQWYLEGGTSAAAPIWATGFSLINQGLIAKKGEFVYGTSTFYAVANAKESGNTSPFNDITKGNNLYYPATSGWDFASGLGTPNLPALFSVIESNA
jgi:kumamolisin